MRVLGFMSGTSLDAIDMAVLETDGITVSNLGPTGEHKLSPETRELVEIATETAQAWARGEEEPVAFIRAARAIAREHVEAAEDFLRDIVFSAHDFDLIAFHGQTVLHERPENGQTGRTVQLGDAALIAKELRVPVAYDFRSADIAAGGQGAPLVPIYHQALVEMSGLEPPVVVLNLGGVANITLLDRHGEMTAFDTGPANGMIDLWVQRHTGRRFDEDGKLAEAGKVNEAALQVLLADDYFKIAGPKSLDRYDFPFEPVEKLSLEDGAATLTAFTAEALRIGIAACHETPGLVIACGGGRLNPTLMDMIVDRLSLPVITAEETGWRGDSIEAEAFAFLGARTAKGLPISFPGTTGVPSPMTGGKIVRP
jgi:anhydro-N-acetylmuramic acid kinase